MLVATLLRIASLLACALFLGGSAQAAPDELMTQAKQAYGRKDTQRLADLQQRAQATRHSQQGWFDYWSLSARLEDATASDVDAFFARWSGTYFEDRLRNDWLLELGKRGDWTGVAREAPRFVMRDDREVACWALLAERRLASALLPPTHSDAAMAAWLAQRDSDQGCQQLALSQVAAGVWGDEQVWRKLRAATEQGRTAAARQAAGLLKSDARTAQAALDNPRRTLERRDGGSAVLALAAARTAAQDTAAAAAWLRTQGERLPASWQAWAWAVVARQAAQGLEPQALGYAQTAWRLQGSTAPDWGDELLAWHTRAALRLGGAQRWPLVERAIGSMTPAAQQQPAWRYWLARALQAQAAAGPAGQVQRDRATAIKQGLASVQHFYGQLAAEELGAPQPLPTRLAPLSSDEQSAAARSAGLQRALDAFALGMRAEAVREWNFSLIGLNDRALRAAAQLACGRAVWDRCINTSERSAEVDFAQRFPMPMQRDVQAAARAAGIDSAYVYGLVRQESRFITDARSRVGAGGLMQVMPATAQWTAKRIGRRLAPGEANDPLVNLELGCNYLKLALEDLDGSEPLAAAAYNAGPGRARRWREGPVLEPAMWAENIPFEETRDYVMKVTSNAAYYAGVMSGKPSPLKARLGRSIGPRSAGEREPVPDLP